jgi:hypothetical protein
VASYLGWRLAGPLEPENLVGVVRGQPADRLMQGDPGREGRQRQGRADGSSRPAGLLPPRPPLAAAMPNSNRYLHSAPIGSDRLRIVLKFRTGFRRRKVICLDSCPARHTP